MRADEQKQRYLPKACSGGLIGGMCMSEPNAGTDVLGLATSAKKDVSAPLRCSFPPAPAEAGGVMCASGRRVGAERVQDVDHKRRRQRL